MDLLSAHALDIPHPLSFASAQYNGFLLIFVAPSQLQERLSDADLVSEIKAQVG